MGVFYFESKRQFDQTDRRYLMVYALIFMCFGGLIEILQQNYVEGRYGDWIDFFANSLGILLVITVLSVFRSIQKES